jgi:hypothetical protein
VRCRDLTGKDADLVEIYELDERKRKPRAVDEEFIQDVKTKISQAATALRSGCLAPVPAAKKCGGCDYRGLCAGPCLLTCPLNMPCQYQYQSLILTLRGQKVLLDADLAAIYGIPTKALNQAVKRNIDRFPEDFMFQLTGKEAATLRSQIVTANSQVADNLSIGASRSQSVTLKRGQNIKYLPRAFTEHDAIMATTVLNSPQAVKMSVFVVRSFVKMRELLAANAAILKRLAEIDKSLIQHDRLLLSLWQQIQPLLDPPPDPLQREIGFHVKDRPAPYRTRRKAIA